MYSFNPRGVCSRRITFDIQDNRLTHVSFMGGCPGNLAAISALIEGMDIDTVISHVKGITCGGKPTSCCDQLAQALEAYKQQFAQQNAK